MMSSGKCSYNDADECQIQPKSLIQGKLHNNEFTL